MDYLSRHADGVARQSVPAHGACRYNDMQAGVGSSAVLMLTNFVSQPARLPSSKNTEKNAIDTFFTANYDIFGMIFAERERERERERENHRLKSPYYHIGLRLSDAHHTANRTTVPSFHISCTVSPYVVHCSSPNSGYTHTAWLFRVRKDGLWPCRGYSNNSFIYLMLSTNNFVL
ncbi:MAG: hypothetical protein LBR06_00320 [Bacteroidales bacterium]|nr:hypothetical protein [Bacteroidales bacterium]